MHSLKDNRKMSNCVVTTTGPLNLSSTLALMPPFKKTLSKVEIGGNFLSVMKGFYKKTLSQTEY